MRFHFQFKRALLGGFAVLAVCLNAVAAPADAVQPMQSLDSAAPTIAKTRSPGEPWVYRFHLPEDYSSRKFQTYGQNLENGPIGVWASAPISWYYNDAGRPAGLVASSAAALTLINQAMAAWTTQCGVSFNYLGTSSNTPSLVVSSTFDGVNVVGWGTLPGNITGVAGVGGNGTTISEGDIVFNKDFNPSLLSTMIHEVGHFLGLRHSDVSGVMMSGPPFTNYSGIGVLAADDINGCRSMFGMPAPSGPSVSGLAQLSGGGNVAQGTQLCFSGSSAVSTCSVGANGQFNCAVPNGWTGTVHLQAGNSRRVAAKRYITGITNANTNQNFTVYDANTYSCNLDIDNNGINDFAVDGAMILRKLIGRTGTAQTVSTSGACAQRTSAQDRSDFLDAQNYEIGGGGGATRDGLVLARLMRLNASGNQLVQGSQAVNGTDLSWSSMQSNISNQCGVSFQ